MDGRMTLWQGQGSNESGTAGDDVRFLAYSAVRVQNQLSISCDYGPDY